MAALENAHKADLFMSETDYVEHYFALGIDPGASWQEARSAFRKQAQAWHPDRFPEASEQHLKAKNNFTQINAAYNAIDKFYRAHGFMPVNHDSILTQIHRQAQAARRPKDFKFENKPQASAQAAATMVSPTQRALRIQKLVLSLVILVLTSWVWLNWLEQHPTGPTRINDQMSYSLIRQVW